MISEFLTLDTSYKNCTIQQRQAVGHDDTCFGALAPLCRSVCAVDMLEYMQEAEKRIPTFRGIKYSHLDLTEATQCAVYGDRKYNILWGVDQVRHSLVRLRNVVHLQTLHRHFNRMSRHTYVTST